MPCCPLYIPWRAITSPVTDDLAKNRVELRARRSGQSSQAEHSCQTAIAPWRLRSFGITHEKLGAESSKLFFCSLPLSVSRHRLNRRSTDRMNRLPGLASGCPSHRRKPAEERPSQQHIHHRDPCSRFAVPVHREPRRQQVHQHSGHKQNQIDRRHQIGVVPLQSQRHNHNGARGQSRDASSRSKLFICHPL